MLDPKNNRIDYGEQLIPPNGYELVQAVGTTYSLDLEILMVLPVALFYSQTLDGDIEQLRYDILDAITKAADKIKVYYQNGQLKVPKKYHNLMAHWENGIEAVTMPNYLSSFHPKIWVIRYESKEQPVIYRLLITSRNLTLARDWDIAFTAEGIVTNEEQPTGKPLVHFLNFLNNAGKQKISDSFIKDLMKVKFDIPKNFILLNFIPFGIDTPENRGKYPYSLTADNAKWDEMVIISPFLDKKTLESLKKITAKAFLLSRKEELDSIPEDTLKKFQCWQFSKFIQEAEFYQELSEEEILPLEQNLHAKIYIAMKEKIPYWYLGSGNCSDAAQNRNIESMVEIKGTNTQGLRARDVLNLLTGQVKAANSILFTPYDFNARSSTEEQENIDSVIRKIKYDLSILTLKGKVELIQGGSAYNLLIEIDASSLTLPESFKVKLKPLPERQKASVILKAGSINSIKEFTGYPETELSPFIEFEIFKDNEKISSFLLPMDIELPETRLNKIITSIIDSRDKFLKYLTFLLTGEEIELIGNNPGPTVGPGNDSFKHWAIAGTPVFEKLLIAASRYPDKLKSINKLIECIKLESKQSDEPIITPEFESFWQIFQKFIKNK
jgi:hypothetical protein